MAVLIQVHWTWRFDLRGHFLTVHSFGAMTSSEVCYTAICEIWDPLKRVCYLSKLSSGGGKKILKADSLLH